MDRVNEAIINTRYYDNGDHQEYFFIMGIGHVNLDIDSTSRDINAIYKSRYDLLRRIFPHSIRKIGISGAKTVDILLR